MPLSTPRIAGVDVVRGLALLGMFSVHVFGAFEPDDSPTVAWQLAGGRSSATFALVAGVGLAFTTGGRTPRVGRGSLTAVTARALSVGLIGLLLGYAANAGGLQVDVILAFYALLFLLALPLLALRARTLACIALALGVVAPFLVHLLRGRCPNPPSTVIRRSRTSSPTRPASSATCSSTAPIRSWRGRRTCAQGSPSGASTSSTGAPRPGC